MPLRGSPSGNHWPRSQIITVPPPYCPFGYRALELVYSIGWSSTLDGQAAFPRHKAGLGDWRQSQHHAVELEPQIVNADGSPRAFG